MKNKKLILIFLTTCFVVFTNVINIKAQEGMSLDGTLWKVSFMDYYKPYKNIEEVVYLFDKTNKVKLCLAGTAFRDYRRNLSDPIDLVPLSAWDCSAEGTFKLTGNLVYVELPYHSITATIKGIYMEGQITNKLTDEKMNWAAKKATISSQEIEKPVLTGKELLTKADKQMKQGKYREAIENYTAAIKLNISTVDKLLAFSDRGDAKRELKNYKGAITDYTNFLKLYFKDIGLTGLGELPDINKEIVNIVFNNRGIAKYRIGDKDGACDDFLISFSSFDKDERKNKIGYKNAKKFCKFPFEF